MLSFAFRSNQFVFLGNTMIICNFGLYFEFNIILDCIEIYLNFNQNFNLVF